MEDNSTVSTSSAPQPAKQLRKKNSGPRWLRRLRRRFLGRLPLTRIIIIFVVFVLIISIGALVFVTDATNRINTSLANLERVVSSVSSRMESGLTLNDFDRLQSSLSDVISTLGSVQRQTGGLRPILSIDNNLQSTLDAIDIVQELARSAREMLNGLQPTLFFLLGRDGSDPAVIQVSAGERLVELLRIGRPSFINAQAHLQNASRFTAAVDISTLSMDALLQFESLQAYHTQLESLQSLLMTAPDLLTLALGLDGDRNYLILSQNSDELRPSGGYVSTYGWLTVRRGRIIDYGYSPTTASSPNPPPDTRANEIDIPSWWINYARPAYAAWDGSWSPDFPTTAQMAMWFYNNGNNPGSPVDGVIAIDIVAFEYILQALRQVTVPEYGIAVNTSNFRDVVYDIRAFGEGDSPHKQFLAALYRQIFADWQATASDPQKNSAILTALLRGLQEKHIMFSLADENINDALSLLGWDGKQHEAAEHDYLLVVDANLGNKSNSSIRRQIIYDVEIQPDQSVISYTTVLYDYPASIASSDPAVNEEYHGRLDYNNLLQVYVPVGSMLTETTGGIVGTSQVHNPTNSQFIGRLTVPFDSSERVRFSYVSPDVVQSVGEFERYRLLVQKQPGMRSEIVNIQVTLPSDAQVVSTTPKAVASYDIGSPILEFRFEMTGDQEIQIVFKE